MQNGWGESDQKIVLLCIPKQYLMVGRIMYTEFKSWCDIFQCLGRKINGLYGSRKLEYYNTSFSTSRQLSYKGLCCATKHATIHSSTTCPQKKELFLSFYFLIAPTVHTVLFQPNSARTSTSISTSMHSLHHTPTQACVPFTLLFDQ